MPKLCNFFANTGTCRYGDQCRFSHQVPYNASDVPQGAHRGGRGGGRSPWQAQRYGTSALGSEPAFDERCWVHATGSPGGSADCPAASQPSDPRQAPPGGVRVMSYNILADSLAQEHRSELYPSTPKWCLRWEHRLELVVRELRRYSPDVACLQEVDHYDDLAARLGELGYEGQYARRTGARSDGCATFWRTARLQRRASDVINFNEMNLRDNVALILALELLVSGGSSTGGGGGSSTGGGGGHSSAETAVLQAGAPLLLVVGNVHVLFNQKRGDIKIAQLRITLERMAQLAAAAAAAGRGGSSGADAGTAAGAETGGHPGSACLLLGDFNAVPGSGLYSFLSTGQLDLLQCERRTLSGQLEGYGYAQLQRHAQRQRQQGIAPWAQPGPHPAAASANPMAQQPAHTVTSMAGAAATTTAAAALIMTTTAASDAGPAVGVPYAPQPAAPITDDASYTIHASSPAADAGSPSLGAAAAADNQQFQPAGRYGSRRARDVWSLEELETAQGHSGIGPTSGGGNSGPQSSAVARHPLAIRSAYATVTGREPPFTSCHAKCVDSVDFIWYTPACCRGHACCALVPVAVLLPPDPLRFPRGLPAADWPSDHVSLVADFSLTLAAGGSSLGGDVKGFSSGAAAPHQPQPSPVSRDTEMPQKRSPPGLLAAESKRGGGSTASPAGTSNAAGTPGQHIYFD